jgi:hypothetical protein
LSQRERLKRTVEKTFYILPYRPGLEAEAGLEIDNSRSEGARCLTEVAAADATLD